MPLCVGKKACARARCKKRCKSWFTGMDDVLKMCKNACSASADELQSRDDFLCSGKYINDDRILAQYHIDGCSTNDYGHGDFGNEGKTDLWKSTMPFIVLLVILIVVVFFYFKR